MVDNPHVLLVDDDADFVIVMAKYLSSKGFRISVANHFTVALEVLESDDRPDILVVDIVMPASVNGLALSRMARMRCPEIRTIYLTGFDLGEIENQAHGPILRKPIEPDQLMKAIQTELATPHH